jgi:hypothetical protein
VKAGAGTCKRQLHQVARKPLTARTAAGETSGGQMAAVALIVIFVLVFFAAGFTVGVLIIGAIGRWTNRRQRRRVGRGRDADRN